VAGSPAARDGTPPRYRILAVGSKITVSGSVARCSRLGFRASGADCLRHLHASASGSHRPAILRDAGGHPADRPSPATGADRDSILRFDIHEVRHLANFVAPESASAIDRVWAPGAETISDV